MRVFVAGGTGAVGRALVPRLVATGHVVAATTRSVAKIPLIESLGAEAIVVDALDSQALAAAVRRFRPVALMNQLTSLPRRYKPRGMKPWYMATSQLRVEATRTLLQAATDVGASRFVYQSIAFMYAPAGPPVVDEEAPVALTAPEPFGTAVKATVEGERMTTSATGVTGIVLRYGHLYGPSTYYASDGDFARQAHRRMLPIVGDGRGVFSFLHVDDAATSAVAALERGDGVYNITDDDPASMLDWVPKFCGEVGAPAPIQMPALFARLAAGKLAVWLATGRGASNAKAKRDLDWTPSRPTWRAGFLC